jgi:16S rRNA (guanine527-N7)-methyltransferase
MGIQASDQQVSRLAHLADLLENEAVNLGFLGPNEGPRVVSRHLLESAALLPFLGRKGRVVDVGSGAGLPGLVLAALDREVVLVEAQAKRADFLRAVAGELPADVEVVQARAEDAARGPLRDASPFSVARALAEAPVAMELCLPFVEPGGQFVLMATRPEAESAGDRRDEGGGEERPTRDSTAPAARATASAPASGVSEDAGAPIASSSGAAGADQPGAAPSDLAAVAALLGGDTPRWVEMSVPGAPAPRWVMIVDKRHTTPDRFPRRAGTPQRRPLGGDVTSVN